jgi:hypothetical protein
MVDGDSRSSGSPFALASRREGLANQDSEWWIVNLLLLPRSHAPMPPRSKSSSPHFQQIIASNSFKREYI